MAREAALVRPLRVKMLERLTSPASASGLARQLRVARQKVNYHLRALEKAGLVELVEERRVGNCVERVVRATGRAYLVGAEALAALAAPPGAEVDRFSSAYLTAVAARAVGEVASLRARAERAGQRLATYTLQTEVRFASAADRARFFDRLGEAVAYLVAQYHDAAAPDGRPYHLFLGAYPAKETKEKR